ncbi:MAG: Glyoxalase/bleomycin resistance protein/dioxygenase [Frankiales bacterium]|nr:Glyoxalase/bleomycin resistance protein/dioxygenase [Frankiales bacterium]
MIPPRLSFVTLGARDLRRLRAFYGAWGWQELPGSDEDFAQYSLGSTRFALYRLDLLREEAAPTLALPEAGSWSGVTLAVNVESPEEVDAAYASALAAGAGAVAAPVQRTWGGRSGYVSDPEGHRWEIAYLPGLLSP